MNFSREMVVRFDRNCRGCSVVLKKQSIAYSMPDGIYCLKCKDNLEDEIKKRLSKKIELTDEDIERMNEETDDPARKRSSVDVGNKKWEVEGD